MSAINSMFDISNYRDIRYHDFHIYRPGKGHNFSLELDKFPGVPNSFWYEDLMLKYSDQIHRSLSKWYYSFYISLGYLVAIVALRQLMRNREPVKMRGVLIGWNAMLAIFSIMGTVRCMPEFMHVLYNNGLKHSYSQSTYYFDYRVNCWYLFFTLSKAFELLDTGFVLLRKRPLIALHWVHHLLTLNFSWFVFPDAPATARWMVNMNFAVHSLMYTYYAVKVANFHVPRPISVTITTLQIAQMFVGLFVHYKALQLKLLGLPCDGSLNVLLIGFSLYFLFAVLFINFFIYTYVIRRSGKLHSAVKHIASEINHSNSNGSAKSQMLNGNNNNHHHHHDVGNGVGGGGGALQYKFIAKKVQ